MDLLPEDDDEETGRIREHLETNFSGVEESLDTIETAVGRAATAVQVLRALSGVDGIPFEPSKLSDTWRIFAERSSLPIDRIDHLSVIESANAMLIGHPAIYAQALEIVMEALWEMVPSNDGLSISFQGAEDEASNHSRLIIHYPALSNGQEESHLDEIKSHIGHLLRPYGSTLEFFQDRTELTLLVKHEKEGDAV